MSPILTSVIIAILTQFGEYDEQFDETGCSLKNIHRWSVDKKDTAQTLGRIKNGKKNGVGFGTGQQKVKGEGNCNDVKHSPLGYFTEATKSDGKRKPQEQ